jgi:hypothetical protein
MSETAPKLGTNREATSPAGHRVALAIECAGSPNAQPLYVIARYKMKGGLQDVRYVRVTYGRTGMNAWRPKERASAGRSTPLR